MKRHMLFIATAVAAAFSAPAFAQVQSGANSAQIVGWPGNMPHEPKPAPRENRSKAWMDNGTRRLGDLLAAKYRAMEKMAESWARRTGIRRNQYVAASPAWA